MDIIANMPLVFLGSRLKRLAEQMQADSSLLASATGTHVPPGLYPVLAQLSLSGKQTVSELAQSIRVSQPAMTKSVNKLVEVGLVVTESDARDKRKSIIALTGAGRNVVQRGEEIVWPLLERVVQELVAGLNGSFIEQIAQLEQRIMTESLTERAQRLYPLSLQPADERDIEAIVSLLNRAYRSSERAASWTSETGMIDGDRISAATLREEIASKPDATLLVWKPEDKVAGCVWLEPVTADLWYLGSLAVDPQRQNGGNGRKILEAAEQWCHLYGAKRIQMTVLEKRKELVAWYERRGYQQTGETEPFPLDDTRFGIPLVADLRFVFMEKSL